jgi:hypothetical protein
MLLPPILALIGKGVPQAFAEAPNHVATGAAVGEVCRRDFSSFHDGYTSPGTY